MRLPPIFRPIKSLRRFLANIASIMASAEKAESILIKTIGEPDSKPRAKLQERIRSIPPTEEPDPA